MTDEQLMSLSDMLGKLHRGLAVLTAVEVLGLVALVVRGSPQMPVIVLSIIMLLTHIVGACEHVALMRRMLSRPPPPSL
jgi:hypothetical protein